MTNQVTFPTNVGGDGSTVTDDSNATTGLANGGFRVRLLPMFTQIIAIANWILGTASTVSTNATNAAGSASAASTSASNAASSASAAGTSASNASTSATNAQNYAAALTATSTTVVAIGIGSKTFATQANKQFAVGQFVSAVSAGTPTNYMHGQVTAYSGTSLTVNVLDVGGSGSPSDWNISISGTQGTQGAQGPQGAAGQYAGIASGAVDEVKGANIASAATVNLETATGNLVHITGTTTITAITLNSGAERTVVFDGVLTLAYNAASLILPGGANITTAAGDTMIVRGDGAGNARVIDYVRASGVALAAPALPYLHVREQQPSGSSAGNSISGTQVRVLNTVVTNTVPGASLSGNQITLPAGIFRVSASAPANTSGNGLYHQASVFSVSDSVTLVTGTSESLSEYLGYSMQTRSVIIGSFTLSAPKTIVINHYTSLGASPGLGKATTSGLGEVYTEVEITKVA
ncbi:hypothetical protein [Paraburkholderia sp. DGU8]|uniref:hypothetical protein n=1 Tax=Paraburkholderia sp. DGU8 TaxID=3161997 RepID=UPI0034667226